MAETKKDDGEWMVEEMAARLAQSRQRVEELKKRFPELAKKKPGRKPRSLPKGVKEVKLADGSTRYRVRVYIGIDPEAGKQLVETHTFDTLKQAEAKAEALRVQRNEGVRVKPKKITLSKYLKDWLKLEKEGNIKPRTLYDYQGLVERYVTDPPEGCPRIGRLQLRRLTPQAFQAYYDHLWREVGLAPRTLQYLHTVVKQGLTYAVRMGDLAKNPLTGVKPKTRSMEDTEAETGDVAAKARKAKAMTKDEAVSFLKKAKEDRYSALWHLLLMGGFRPSEALGLLWPNVDLDKGEVYVRKVLTRVGVKGWRLTDPKTDRSTRPVPLPPVVVKELKEWKAQQARERLKLGAEYADHGFPFVFTTPFGQPLDSVNLASRNYRRILQAAELGTWEGEGEERVFKPGFRVYDLRHTCATLLLLAGENAKSVSERLGHSSTAFTMDVYGHVLPTLQESAVRKLEVMFGKG